MDTMNPKTDSHRIRILTAMGWELKPAIQGSYWSAPDGWKDSKVFFTERGSVLALPLLTHDLLSAARERLLVTDELWDKYLEQVMDRDDDTSQCFDFGRRLLSASLAAHAEALCAALKI